MHSYRSSYTTATRGWHARLISPYKRFRDGQDGPDEPRGVNDDETLEILPQSETMRRHSFARDSCFRFSHSWSDVGAAESFSLSVDHLVASLQPDDAGHLPAGRRSVEVNDHVIFRHQQLQAADDVPDGAHTHTQIKHAAVGFPPLFLAFIANNHFTLIIFFSFIMVENKCKHAAVPIDPAGSYRKRFSMM